MHLFSLYRQYGYQPGDFPNAERIGEQTLTLPLFPGMEEKDVDQVCRQCFLTEWFLINEAVSYVGCTVRHPT